MQTPIQELLEVYSELTFDQFNDWLCNNEKRLLEEEKERMINFGYKCRDNQKKMPQDIFNQTYNQKK